MSWIVATMEWAAVLDMIRGIAEASRTGVELTIDADMPQAVTMEACFVKTRVIW